MITAIAPPADNPATNTRFGSPPSRSITSRVMPAISDGSPQPRCWFSLLNQFQHFDTFAPDPCSG